MSNLCTCVECMPDSQEPEMSNEDKMQQKRAEFAEGFSHSDDRLNAMLGWDEGVKACAAIKDAEIAQLKTYNADLHKNLAESNELLAAANKEIASRDLMIKYLTLRLRDLCEVIDEPPERNCSCHISPPCNDCVEYGGLREALVNAQEVLVNSEHHDSEVLEKMLLEAEIAALEDVTSDAGRDDNNSKELIADRKAKLAELNKE